MSNINSMSMSMDGGREHKTIRLGTGHGEKMEMGGVWLLLSVYLFGIIIFSLCGATMFMLLDGGSDTIHENEQKNKCNDTQAKVMQTFVQVHGNKTVAASKQKLLKAVEEVVNCLKKDESIHYPLYRYESAIIYVVSTYTTMGYGNVNCKSDLGRTMTILYAMIGIPLFFGFYLDASQAFRMLLNILVYKCGLSTRLDPQHIPRIIVPVKFTRHKRKIRRITLAVTMLTFIVFMLSIGAIAQVVQPDWSLLSAMYFIFQSLTLVGYGDVMPHPGWKVCLLTPFILIGTVFFGVIALILQEEIQKCLVDIVKWGSKKEFTQSSNRDVTVEADALANT